MATQDRYGEAGVVAPAARRRPYSFWLIPSYLLTTVCAFVLLSLALARPGGATADASLLVFAAISPCLLAITALYLRGAGEGLHAIGLLRPAKSTLREIAAWSSVTAVFLLLWFVLASVLADVTVDGLADRFVTGPSWLPGDGGLALAIVALGFAVQGSCEEWVFRGFVQHVAEGLTTATRATILSSALFALAHATSPAQSGLGLLNTFLIGVILALVSRATGSLWPAMAMHGAWNFLVASVLSLPVSGVDMYHMLDLRLSGPRWITGGGYGPEASAVLTPMLVAACALLIRRAGARPATSTTADAGLGEAE